MKFVRTFEAFKSQRSTPLNEELFGLGKLLKNKLSMGFSKMFGSAKNIDKAIDDYKKELDNLYNPVIEQLEKYAKLVENKPEDFDIQAKSIIDEYTKVKNNYEKQKNLVRDKFDLKTKEIIKNEKNDKVNLYIQLKKIEVVQEMINRESELLSKIGLNDKEVANDKFLTSIVADQEDLAKKTKEMADKLSNELKSRDDSTIVYKVGDVVKYKDIHNKEQVNRIIKIDGDEVSFKAKSDNEPFTKMISDIIEKVDFDENEYKEGDTVIYKLDSGEENEGTITNINGDEITLDTENTKGIKKHIFDIISKVESTEKE